MPKYEYAALCYKISCSLRFIIFKNSYVRAGILLHCSLFKFAFILNTVHTFKNLDHIQGRGTSEVKNFQQPTFNGAIYSLKCRVSFP